MTMITRSKAEALIPETVSKEIVQSAIANSSFLSMAKKLQNMSSKTHKIPVLSNLPSAYFVNGDTGMKGVSSQAWKNVYIFAEELAVIVPMPEAVLDDADYDIWGEVKPRIAEAFGAKIDNAVYFGTDAPETWPKGIVPGANDAGNVVTYGTGKDLYDDLLAEDGSIALLEDDGYIATGHVASINMKAKLRGLRDENGSPIFNSNTMQSKTQYTLDGENITFPLNGVMDKTKALMISGQFNQAVYSIRQDITFKILDQATLDMGDGTTLNLAQQDCVALRAVMRLGWQLPNPVNLTNTDEETRYPFSVLAPNA